MQEIHRQLGIPLGYPATSKLPYCREPAELVDTEADFYQRSQKLTPEAFQAWTQMKQAATEQGFSLFLISAFRDIEYQRAIFEKKLARGVPIEEILTVNAAPGYSEHHTGCAIDAGTSGCDALVEEFENTEIFQWLTKNAADFKYFMSYPRDNSYGICYEPWHWCFRPAQAE